MGKRKRGSEPKQIQISKVQQVHQLKKKVLSLIRKSRSSKLRNVKKTCKQADQDLKNCDKEKNLEEYNNLLEKKKKSEENLEEIKNLDADKLLEQMIVDLESLSATEKRIIQTPGLVDMIKEIQVLQVKIENQNNKRLKQLAKQQQKDEESEDDQSDHSDDHKSIESESDNENEVENEENELSDSFDSAEELGVVCALFLKGNLVF